MFGAGVGLVWGSMDSLSEAEYQEALAMLSDFGCTELDTARIYGGGKAEAGLGAALHAAPVPLRESFVVHSKASPNQTYGTLSAAGLQTQGRTTMAALRLDQLDIYYLHSVDEHTDLVETLEQINEMHKHGMFRRFGLSNFSAWQTTQAWYICKQRGWVLPSVYQGLYNPLSRSVEFEVLPACKTLGIAFYAYSPLAGGVLARSTSTARAGYRSGMTALIGGRGDEGRAAAEEAMRKVEAACDRCVPPVKLRDVAFRWFFHHSALGPGDAVIGGASKLSQIAENLQALDADNGPLPEPVLAALEGAWAAVAGPPYHPTPRVAPVAKL